MVIHYGSNKKRIQIVITGMQIKTMTIYTPIRIAKTKLLTIANTGEDAEKLDLS